MVGAAKNAFLATSVHVNNMMKSGATDELSNRLLCCQGGLNYCY